MTVPRYTKINHVSHRSCHELFKGPIIIEEKIDGSQVSFQLGEDGPEFRSKGVQQSIHGPDKLFIKAAEVIKNLDLYPDHVYRGEYLRKPKHNILTYGRVPTSHIVLYDVMLGKDTEHYAPPSYVKEEAIRLGIEPVRVLYVGEPISVEQIMEGFLHRDSQLGGCKMEGVVIKALGRNLFGRDGKPIIAKLVAEQFAEVARSKGHKVKFTKGTGDVIDRLVDALKTEARWNKAVQHLREDGKLTDSVQDIGPLIKEVQVDTHREEEEWIKDQLFKWAWKQVSRQLTRGLPEWYKAKLMEGVIDATRTT